MFVDVAIAAAIESAEARLTHGVGHILGQRFAEARLVRLGKAVALSSGQDSPFDKVIGLGFEPFPAKAFLTFEAEALGAGRAVRVETSTLANTQITRFLSERGYVLVGFENVLVRRLDEPSDEARATNETGPTRAEHETRAKPAYAANSLVRAARPDELETWIDVVTRGFLSPDVSPTSLPPENFALAGLRQIFLDLAADPTFCPLLAWRDGHVAGGASLRLDEGLAQFTGAATLPQHRRRGVQSALLRARLAYARGAGATLATLTTEPGSRSQENAMRAGFALGYARSIFVKGSSPGA